MQNKGENKMSARKFTDQSYNYVILEDEMKVICLPKV